MRQLTPPIDDYRIKEEPFYLPTGEEVALFEAAHKAGLPFLLKGPTGCGKTRFVSYMAHKLGVPLITVACHEELTATDLLGRYLITGDETVWMDGPLTTGVRQGAIVYLDEVVQARSDTLVLLHPVTDYRRFLPIDKLGVVLQAPSNFMLVVSYNPGFQSVLKEFKPATRQRFVAVDFDYPGEAQEGEILLREAGVSKKVAKSLVQVGRKLRNLADRGLDGGVSTRSLVSAGTLIAQGISPEHAAASALTAALTDDPDVTQAIQSVLSDFF